MSSQLVHYLIQIFELFIICGAFPHLREINDHVDSQQDHTSAIISQNIPIKERIAETVAEIGKKQQTGETKLLTPKIEKTENEDGIRYGTSDEDGDETEELRVPLDVVISRIEEESKGFHEQMELTQKGEAAKEGEPFERARMSHSLTVNDAAEYLTKTEEKGTQISMTEEKKKNATTDQKPSIDLEKERNSENVSNFLNETNEVGNAKIMMDGVNRMEKMTGDANIIMESGNEGSKVAEEIDGESEGAGAMDKGQRAHHAPLISAAELPSDNQFGESNEGNVRQHPQIGKEDVGSSEVSTEVQNKGGTVTLWEQIVLGLRCARQDCRDTLVTGGEQLPRIITGWKMTRRARTVIEREQNEAKGAERRFCGCKST